MQSVEGGAILVTLGVVVPWLTRPKVSALPAPAVENERTCTGCEQCWEDCPWDAISMVVRSDGSDRSDLVARVADEMAVSQPELAVELALVNAEIRAGICEGFIGNRILSAYRRQADYMLADGALPGARDRRRSAGFGWRTLASAP